MELLTLMPLSIWDPFIAFGSAIMHVSRKTSGILVLAHSIFSPVFGADNGWTPGAVHHVPHRCHPSRLDPAVRQADQVLTQYAVAPTQGARAPEETWSRTGRSSVRRP